MKTWQYDFFLKRGIALENCKPYEGWDFDYFVYLYILCTYDRAHHIIGAQEICVEE